MKKRFYVVFVARDADGSINKVPVPIQFVYCFVGAAVVGLFTIAGLAGSYSRMLLKTERFNQVRAERESLRRDYAKLEKREREKEVQAASLGALASEVSALYGLTAGKLVAPAGRLFSRDKHAATSSGTLSGQLAPASGDAALTNVGYQKSLDEFNQLRDAAFTGAASRTIAGTWNQSSPLGAFGPTFGPSFDSAANAPTLWPVIGPITSPFGGREDPILGDGEGEFHKGVDISAAYGTPIHATAAGMVEMAGGGHGYGTEVVINNGGGIRTVFGHMSGLHCSVGQQVVRGQVIGYVGHSGRATGNHVHYEVRVHDVPVNPHKYLRDTSIDSAVSSAGL